MMKMNRLLLICCLVVTLLFLHVSADSLTNFELPFHIEPPVNWFGFGWLWLDFGMLFRESLCTTLVNNVTDPILLGTSIQDEGYLAVMGPELDGYLVPREELSATHFALSDRYEVTPIHLAWEWRNVTLLPGERVLSMHLKLGGKANNRPEMVAQTTTHRMTMTSRSWEVFTENWSPPDGVVFLSITRASQGKLLAIRNQQHQICLIRWWEEMAKVTPQRLGQPWGPVGVEHWPASLCIPSVSPVTCAGVIEPAELHQNGSNSELHSNDNTTVGRHRILATFINRTVSLLEFRSSGFTVVRHFGRFRMFFDCYDTNRYILVVLVILFVITVVLGIIYLIYRILRRRIPLVVKGPVSLTGPESSMPSSPSSIASSTANSSYQRLSSVPRSAQQANSKQKIVTKEETSPRVAPLPPSSPQTAVKR